MTQSKSRRTFLGNILSTAAGAWVALGAVSLTGCPPVAKYGGPTPEPVKYGGPPPDLNQPPDIDQPPEPTAAPSVEPTAAPTAAPTTSGAPTVTPTAELPPGPADVVAKYGGPPPIVKQPTKYGGPPQRPKYGGFQR